MLQFTGLSAGILASMAKQWDLRGLPVPDLAYQFRNCLGWMDVMNIDLKVLGELLAFLPEHQGILDFGRTLSLVPLATVYMWVALILALTSCSLLPTSLPPYSLTPYCLPPSGGWRSSCRWCSRCS